MEVTLAETAPEEAAGEAQPGKIKRNWDVMAKILRSAAEKTCGRTARKDDFYADSRIRQEAVDSVEKCSVARKTWQEARGSQGEEEKRIQRNLVCNEERGIQRRMRKELLDEICPLIEKAIKDGDEGSKYRLIRELGFDLRDRYNMRATEVVTAEQHKQSIMEVAGTANDAEVGQDPLAGVPQTPIQEHLGIPPTDSEIDDAVNKMRDSSAGKDEVRIDMIRTAPERFKEELRRLIGEMWESPQDEELWTSNTRSSKLVLLFKKGDRKDPKNYRAISLLCIVSRIIARIIARRLDAHWEKEHTHNEAQWGFRRGRSARDVILIIRLLMEQFAAAESRVLAAKKTAEKKSADGRLSAAMAARFEAMMKALERCRILATPVDIRKAYPNTNRTKMEKVMDLSGVPKKLSELITMLHSSTGYTIQGKTSEDTEVFYLLRGLREGCPSSPFLFNIYHDISLKALQTELEGIAMTYDGGCLQHTSEEGPESPGCKWQLKVVGFVDDTTPIGVFDPLDPLRDERLTTEVFKGQLQQVHDGKTEFLIAKSTNSKWKPPEKQAQKDVRLLGGWIDTDCGTVKDTTEKALQRGGKLAEDQESAVEDKADAQVIGQNRGSDSGLHTPVRK